VVSLLFCFVAVVGWAFWHFGAPSSIDSPGPWFPWSLDLPTSSHHHSSDNPSCGDSESGDSS
jgi:hypothetical protein